MTLKKMNGTWRHSTSRLMRTNEKCTSENMYKYNLFLHICVSKFKFSSQLSLKMWKTSVTTMVLIEEGMEI